MNLLEAGFSGSVFTQCYQRIGGSSLALTQPQLKVETAPPSGHVRDPEDTQRRLLAAGLAVFARKGYGAASVNEIVREAGCSKGAFYCHFAAKEELFLTILESRIQGNHERLLELCPWKGSCAQWVSDMFSTMVSFGDRDPIWRALSAEFMAHGVRDPRIGRRIGEMHEVLRSLIADTLRQCASYGMQSLAADPEIIAAVLVAMLDGVGLHTALEPDRLPVAETLERLKPLLEAWFPEE